VRDAAIFAILYGLGLRRSELTALNRDEYQPEQCRILIRGKGKTVRFRYVVGAPASR
jgi:site-specific recombinase XerC